MALVINTNVASLNAQNNLNKSQGQLDQALARLSSGLRINSPADDPAGYAISQRMTSQINGFNQAVRNANDGISFAQVANGALNTVTDSLQRIRTLAVQAANATNSAQDRQALNSEVQQAIQQVNTTAQNTQFNGQSILNGSLGSLTFQVGANANQTITANSIDVRGQSLGATYGDGSSVFSGTLSGSAAGSFTITGSDGAATIATTAGASISDVLSAINNASSQTGVYAQSADSVSGELSYASGGASTLTVNGVSVSIASGASLSDAVTSINAYSSQTGVTATSSGASGIVLSDTTGAAISFSASGTASIKASGSTDTSGTFQAGLELYTKVGGTIKVSGTATELATYGFITSGSTSTSASLDSKTATLNSTNVQTVADSQLAIKAMDFALTQMSQFGGELGALQSRFQSTISNLQTASQNTEAARSRIQDTNFASETAALSRAQILQQAGVAMVAQANSQPQVALSLLK
jgi:flagellin